MTQPFTAEETARIKADFLRDGFRLIPGVLGADEVAAMVAATDRVLDDPAGENLYDKTSDLRFIGVRLFETDPLFLNLLTREPIISLAEALLGSNCHLIAQNVVRNQPGTALDTFHVDDAVLFPVGEGMERHDPRLPMPLSVVTVQMALTDIESIEYGPTEYVPGSHFSGRMPNDPAHPTFEGRGPQPMLCKAGDIYLHNGQCWHRGNPNTSQRTRYLLQNAYSVRWFAQRFYPFIKYRMPEHLLQNADARLARVLGAHPGHGGYG
jgi:ectoine hydroxylase-related dioxygenase (phytanoyl-CoA dioxygenase family)